MFKLLYNVSDIKSLFGMWASTIPVSLAWAAMFVLLPFVMVVKIFKKEF